MSILKTKKTKTGDFVAFSELAIRNNHSIVEYCRTCMSALSGCTAGVLGLTGLLGFLFFFLSVFVLWVLVIFKAGRNWEKYFVNRKNLLTSGVFSDLHPVLDVFVWNGARLLKWKLSNSSPALCFGVSPFSQAFCQRPQNVEDVNRLDYFEVLGLPRKYQLSRRALSASFRALQAKLHPDKFVSASDQEQVLSSDSSSLVNRAYAILKNSHSRGLHLLEIEGKNIKDEVVAPAFLMEMLEINEEIEGCKERERLHEIFTENEAKIAANEEKLQTAFDAKNYDSARMLLAEMKYFENIREKLRALGFGDD
ncbi:unnamed protein product [Notodromas monacha]|uniref:J domain-containing protein n=1 Tax=Notodromas monacha TaxID=399045 RepID=A0A7R9GAR1_9CRUS|nr:unnamed protein product [Notodromas monacha]CAG0915702.1 unnamed protein product [Notodromas monacha]